MSAGISGTAVGVISAGALISYAGFRGVSLSQAMRDLVTGTPPALSRTGTITSTSGTGTTTGTGGGAALVTAAMTHRGERYSQARRWQTGFSDCSSFVGKSFRDIGITPPAGSTTVTLRAWPALRRVGRDELAAGDLIWVPGHVTIAVDNRTAIGQQSRKANVQIGPITALMPSLFAPTYLRYKGW
jgi:cell wall-associated NlpC family hydrolase